MHAFPYGVLEREPDLAHTPGLVQQVLDTANDQSAIERLTGVERLAVLCSLFWVPNNLSIACRSWMTGGGQGEEQVCLCLGPERQGVSRGVSGLRYGNGAVLRESRELQLLSPRRNRQTQLQRTSLITSQPAPWLIRGISAPIRGGRRMTHCKWVWVT